MTFLVSLVVTAVGAHQTLERADAGGFDPRKVLFVGIFGLIVAGPALAGLAASVEG
jgi:hypothetical protein